MIESKAFIKESNFEIEDLIRKHNVEINDFKTAYQRLESSVTEKDKNIRDIDYKYHNEQSKTKDLEQQLQNLHKEKLDLERNLMSEIQSLNHRLNEQQGTFSQMRQHEIETLKQSISQLNSEKHEKEIMYNSLYNEYQTLVQNINSLPSDNAQAISTLQNRDKENQQYIEKLKSDAWATINQKKQIIQQLTNDINQFRNAQQAIEPEQVKVDIQELPLQPRINPEEPYRVHEGTRSQGPAIIGEEIIHQVLDDKGSIAWQGKTFKLAGKEYSAPQYALNLIKHNRSNEVKNFKNAFIENLRNVGDKSTYDDKRFVNKAIELLEETANQNKEIVAIVMRTFLDIEGDKINAEFKRRYAKDYEKYLPKQYNSIYGKN